MPSMCSFPTLLCPQVWLEFYRAPSSRERELIEGVLKAWFMLGKLGGYNSQNMQVGGSVSTPPAVG